MDTIKSWINSFGAFVRGNPYIMAILILVLISYASLVAPKLPLSAMKIFDNTIFKVIFFTIILLFARYSFTVSLIMALAFVISITALSRLKSLQLIGDISSINLKSAEKKLAQEIQPQEQIQEEDTQSYLAPMTEPATTDFEPPTDLYDAQSATANVKGVDPQINPKFPIA